MPMRRLALVALSAIFSALAAAPAAAQPAQGAARDIFRKASSRFGKPAASQPASAPTASAKKAPKPRQESSAPNRSEEKTQPAPAVVQQVSDEAPALEPLGLRYSLIRQVGTQGAEEVDPDTVFRSGDRIKLRVQSSDRAFLYLVLRGSSGRWRVLFPTPAIANGDNRVGPDETYMVPSHERAWFAFDDQVGEERLFILLSRRPQANLERMIYDLRRSQGASEAPQAEPGAAPEGGTKVMLASSQREVEDEIIAGIRQTAYSRDLVFEKVAEDSQEPDWRKAVYVAEKEASPDSRIVADVRLEHR